MLGKALLSDWYVCLCVCLFVCACVCKFVYVRKISSSPFLFYVLKK